MSSKFNSLSSGVGPRCFVIRMPAAGNNRHSPRAHRGRSVHTAHAHREICLAHLRREASCIHKLPLQICKMRRDYCLLPTSDVYHYKASIL